MRIELNYPTEAIYRGLTTIQDLKLANTRIPVDQYIEVESEPESKFITFKYLYGYGDGVTKITDWYTGNTTSSDTSRFFYLNYNRAERFWRIQATDMHGNQLEKTFFFSKLPVVYIDTNKGVDITSKTINVKCNVKIQGNSEFDGGYDGKAEIHGRGSSSWRYYTTQQSYKIKLDKKTDVFGFGSNKHWTLISNFVDNTFVRNLYAQQVAEELGLANVKMTPVVLILNGVCKGVYILAQHIRIGNGTIDVFDWENEAGVRGESETDYAWVDNDDSIEIDGGFVYELERDQDAETTEFKTNGGMNVVVNRPEYAKTSVKMMDFSRNLLNDFEQACQAVDGKTIFEEGKPSRHFSQIADIDSMVKYLLVNMVFNNVDARSRSRYCYIDRGGKLTFGPVWDFDRAMGSVENEDFNMAYDNWNCFQNSVECCYQDWVSHPYFCHLLRQEYINTVRPWFQQKLTELDAKQSYWNTVGIMNDLARRTNSLTHPYIPPNNFTLRGYTSDWNYFKTWMTNRFEWLEAQFENNVTLARSLKFDYAKHPIGLQDLTWTINGSTYTSLGNPEITVNTRNLNISIAQWGVIDRPVSIYKDNEYIDTIYQKNYLNSIAINIAPDKDYAVISLDERDTTQNEYSKVSFITIHVQ